MFHCPVGVWVIGQHAIILSATVRSPTVLLSPATLHVTAKQYPINMLAETEREKKKWDMLQLPVNDGVCYHACLWPGKVNWYSLFN